MTYEKAKAESAVQIVERWIMARLRHQQFDSVHEVNDAIAPLLARLNEKAFQKLPGSRASTFIEIDATSATGAKRSFPYSGKARPQAPNRK